jgi:hypothetical protein
MAEIWVLLILLTNSQSRDKQPIIIRETFYTQEQCEKVKTIRVKSFDIQGINVSASCAPTRRD